MGQLINRGSYFIMDRVIIIGALSLVREDENMKKIFAALIYCLLILCFCACGADKSEIGIEEIIIEDRVNSSEVIANGFKMLLYSDKAVYKTTDEIKIWATLVYMGEGSEVTIWSGSPYMSFSITDGADINIGTIHLLSLGSTVLTRGVAYSFDYEKNSIRYPGMANEQFWEEFDEQDELFLPAGKYTIAVEGKFSLSHEPGAEDSGLLCELEIEVVE